MCRWVLGLHVVGAFGRRLRVAGVLSARHMRHPFGSAARGTCRGACRAAAPRSARLPFALSHLQPASDGAPNGAPLPTTPQANIQKNGSPEDWRCREAATFAFGSILEGPQVETLAQLARSGLGFLLSALKDANPSVKNTTAWTIGARVAAGGCSSGGVGGGVGLEGVGWRWSWLGRGRGRAPAGLEPPMLWVTRAPRWELPCGRGVSVTPAKHPELHPPTHPHARTPTHHVSTPTPPTPPPAGRIFEFVHGEDLQPPLIDAQVLPQIIQVLLEAIKDQPHIAEKVGAGGVRAGRVVSHAPLSGRAMCHSCICYCGWAAVGSCCWVLLGALGCSWHASG